MNTRVPRLTVVDNVVVDLVTRVQRLPSRGHDELSSSTACYVGGAFNVMSAATRLGLRTRYGGLVGTGPFGVLATNALRREGIESLHGAVAESDTGLVVTLIEPDAERTFVTSLGAEATLRPEHVASLNLIAGDTLYFSGYALLLEPNRSTLTALVRSLPEAVTLVFDPGPLVAQIDTSALEIVLTRVDWLSCNRREGLSLSGEDSPTKAATKLRNRLTRPGVIVRDAERGCVVAWKDRCAQVEGISVVARDASGAGDCHVGAFVASLARGHDPFESARIANTAAAFCVAHWGPASGPTSEQLAPLLA